MEFTHFDEEGNAVMVDVSDKNITARTAVAKGKIMMNEECFQKLAKGEVAKGDVLGTARLAGIMGTKKTAELIPLCHLLSITKASIDFEILPAEYAVEAICKVKTVGKTGVEMEALTGATIALLTIYDMCKAIDKTMCITEVHLCSKTGGKSGDFINKLDNSKLEK